jgi:hypothetical protein
VQGSLPKASSVADLGCVGRSRVRSRGAGRKWAAPKVPALIDWKFFDSSDMEKIGEGLVEHYRVYKLDKPKGRIIKGKDMLASGDAEAIHKACADPDCPVCEIWRGAKKIGDIEA